MAQPDGDTTAGHSLSQASMCAAVAADYMLPLLSLVSSMIALG